MLKVRVIPTLLVRNYSLYKGEAFDSWRPVGVVVPAIRVYNAREVDELMVLDIGATPGGGDPDYAAIEEYTSHCLVPLTIGGGVRSVEQIRRVLRAGADKVALCTSAILDSELIRQGASRFGSQCLIASIDAKRTQDGQYECYSHCGTRSTGREVVSWAREVENLGVGEILLTSIDRDGTLQGYDLELISRVCDAVKIPVIASGGAGKYQDMVDAVQKAGASAVAAAAMFHFTQQTPLEAKRYMQSMGIPVHLTGNAR